MKKEFDLEKFKRRRHIYCEEMAPSNFITIVWLISLLITAITYDLEITYNMKFEAVSRFSFIALFYTSMYYIVYWTFSLYYLIRTAILMIKMPQLKEQLKYDKKCDVNEEYIKAKTEWLKKCSKDKEECKKQ